ncbi:hypothetical protein [Bacillus alkalicellulosilyticus]|uniref:hypothetical protein n=1 Tax=Alkalihalobacterium alkalicellulosilyticum TaxID=1912214 RepID=UPI000997BBC6|nr:hypothetical protein [Bacillus alkalicellulosilyticus]
MSNQEELSIYKVLKKIGGKSEEHLRNLVQSILNDDDVIQFVKQALDHHSKKLGDLQEYSEVIATQLNVPSKKDIRNLSKLIKQIEEKVDDIDEKLLTGSPRSIDTVDNIIGGMKDRLQAATDYKETDHDLATIQKLLKMQAILDPEAFRPIKTKLVKREKNDD